MRILYGIQGTGNGHITRARVMAKALRARGIDVDYVFSGRPADEYFDMEVFGDYRTFNGLTFQSEHGKVNHLKTVRQAKLWQLMKDIRSLELQPYDLILNDFEPISAWAGRNHQIPVINISHQAAFANGRVPSEGLGWLNKTILKYFAPADLALGVHWYHFGQNIIPPFIERETASAQANGSILVYMPFEEVSEIEELLNGQHEHQFIVYHPAIKADRQESAITFKPPCRIGFLADLEACSGVMANAGFELSSEALCAGKKLLLKPLEGQFEQASNAKTLSQLGLASVMQSLDETIVESWLQAPQIEAINYPSDPTPLIDWLLEGDYRHPELLCRLLWQSISIAKFSHAQV